MPRKNSKITRKKKCPEGYILKKSHSRKRHSRKAYTIKKKNKKISVKGSVVKPTQVKATCVPDKGAPGKGVDRGAPKIILSDKQLLSSKGYSISKSTATRRKILNDVYNGLLKKYKDDGIARRKILRHLVLLRTYRKNAQHRAEKEAYKRLDEDIAYVQRKWFKK